MIIPASAKAPLAIISAVNKTNVNPIRIAFITKLPNKLIKLQIVFNVVEDVTVCCTVENIRIEIECASFHVLTTFCTTDSSIEIRRTIS